MNKIKHTKMKEYRKRITKVTDEEFFKVYELGLSDPKSAVILGISHSRVYAKRRKFGLVANNPRNGKPNLNDEELQEAHLTHLDSDSRYKSKDKRMKPEKYREISRSYYHSEVHHEDLKKYHRDKMKLYGKTDKVKKRIEEYESTERRKLLKKLAYEKRKNNDE